MLSSSKLQEALNITKKKALKFNPWCSKDNVCTQGAAGQVSIVIPQLIQQVTIKPGTPDSKAKSNPQSHREGTHLLHLCLNFPMTKSWGQPLGSEGRGSNQANSHFRLDSGQRSGTGCESEDGRQF